MILLLILFLCLTWCEMNGAREKGHGVYGKYYSLKQVCWAGFIILGLFTLSQYASAEQRQKELVNEYDALVYQLDVCEGEQLNMSTVNSIVEWNEKIRKLHALQRNIWIGICIPNIYDDFELIDYAT